MKSGRTAFEFDVVLIFILISSPTLTSAGMETERLTGDVESATGKSFPFEKTALDPSIRYSRAMSNSFSVFSSPKRIMERFSVTDSPAAIGPSDAW